MSVQVKTDLPQDSSPILAEVVRGGMVESRHHASVAVVDAHGGIVRAWGDVELPVYGRSAIKPLLAIPLVESGAADRFKLGTAEIALATASHNAEPRHVEMGLRQIQESAAVAQMPEFHGDAPLFHESQDLDETFQLQQGEALVGFVRLRKVAQHTLESEGLRRGDHTE